MKVAALEVEVFQEKEGVPKLHIFPRETRRGKAQWAIWIHPDGSAVLFAGHRQIMLPKNEEGIPSYTLDHVDGDLVFKKV